MKIGIIPATASPLAPFSREVLMRLGASSIAERRISTFSRHAGAGIRCSTRVAKQGCCAAGALAIALSGLPLLPSLRFRFSSKARISRNAFESSNSIAGSPGVGSQRLVVNPVKVDRAGVSGQGGVGEEGRPRSFPPTESDMRSRSKLVERFAIVEAI